MSLKITDHFYYDKELGTYDFTRESPRIHELRTLPIDKTIEVNNLPLTIISFREFGTVDLWWVIATYNNIVQVDSFTETTLNLPLLSEIKRVLK